MYFFPNKKCIIYPVRPFQCKSYPFWPSCTESKESWKEVKKYCLGTNAKNMRHYSFEEIAKLLQQYKKELSIN